MTEKMDPRMREDDKRCGDDKMKKPGAYALGSVG